MEAQKNECPSFCTGSVDTPRNPLEIGQGLARECVKHHSLNDSESLTV
jgi:hypothetical protein